MMGDGAILRETDGPPVQISGLNFRSQFMDYDTARQLLYRETDDGSRDGFLARLRQGLAPVPGQMTHLLLALEVVATATKGQPQLDRPLVDMLYRLAMESRRWVDQGQRRGVLWSALFYGDLDRLQQEVRHIFADTEGGNPG